MPTTTITYITLLLSTTTMGNLSLRKLLEISYLQRNPVLAPIVSMVCLIYGNISIRDTRMDTMNFKGEICMPSQGRLPTNCSSSSLHLTTSAKLKLLLLSLHQQPSRPQVLPTMEFTVSFSLLRLIMSSMEQDTMHLVDMEVARLLSMLLLEV